MIRSLRDLVPSLTIAENLSLAQIKGTRGSLRFPNRHEYRVDARNALSRISMGLDHRMNEQVRFLSGGEKQGLVLARALLFQSNFLLLDEFVSALAHNLASKMIALVSDIVKESRSYCLLVTHEIDLAFKYANQLIFLHNGKLIDNLENNTKSQQRIIELYAQFLKEYIKYEQ